MSTCPCVLRRQQLGWFQTSPLFVPARRPWTQSPRLWCLLIALADYFEQEASDETKEGWLITGVVGGWRMEALEVAGRHLLLPNCRCAGEPREENFAAVALNHAGRWRVTAAEILDGIQTTTAWGWDQQRHRFDFAPVSFTPESVLDAVLARNSEEPRVVSPLLWHRACAGLPSHQASEPWVRPLLNCIAQRATVSLSEVTLAWQQAGLVSEAVLCQWQDHLALKLELIHGDSSWFEMNPPPVLDPPLGTELELLVTLVSRGATGLSLQRRVELDYGLAAVQAWVRTAADHLGYWWTAGADLKLPDQLPLTVPPDPDDIPF